jgi:5-methylcytosine-specific restriction endonuclease McrA
MSPLWPLHAARAWAIAHLTRRSPRWRALERRFLQAFPACAACGGHTLLQVHHVVPIHVDRDRELEWGNLVQLCMGLRLCHLRLGHKGNWKLSNPSVRMDAQRQLDTLRRGRR